MSTRRISPRWHNCDFKSQLVNGPKAGGKAQRFAQVGGVGFWFGKNPPPHWLCRWAPQRYAELGQVPFEIAVGAIRRRCDRKSHLPRQEARRGGLNAI
jgi:hypothetical protein